MTHDNGAATVWVVTDCEGYEPCSVSVDSVWADESSAERRANEHVDLSVSGPFEVGA